MGKDKDEPQEEYSVEKVLQKRIRGGKVRSSKKIIKLFKNI